MISLPEKAFYTTPKKTYIMSLTKKVDSSVDQEDPVFTYLVSKTGETLDAKRFEDDNHLPEMVRLYKYFQADKNNFESDTLRCKTWDIDSFRPDTHWSVDRWWDHDDRVELGVEEARNFTTIEEFKRQLEEEKLNLEVAVDQLEQLKEEGAPEPEDTVSVSLNSSGYFRLSIGSRVLKQEMREDEDGDIPVYSANAQEPWGYMSESNIDDFSHDFVLWGIDGNWEFNVIPSGNKFRTTDHCGAIRIINSDIDPYYLYYYLNWVKVKKSLDRQLRASLTNMGPIEVELPVLTDKTGEPKTRQIKVDVDGNDEPEEFEVYRLDLDTQQEIAKYYKTYHDVRREIKERVQTITSQDMDPPFS